MFPAPIFLVLFAHLFNSSYLQAGIEELTVLVSPDGKQQVILAGDIHDRHPGTQTERLAAAIAECQKQDPSPFEVYIEKPASLFTMFDPSPRITTDLEPALQALNVPGVTVEDCEVRNVAVLAFWLFGQECPDQVFPELVIKTNGKECTVNQATFKDLDIEFEELHGSLTQYAQQLPDYMKHVFMDKLSIARTQIKTFQEQTKPYIQTSNTILEAAIKLAGNHYERERLKYSSFYPFAQLFDLSMVQKILRTHNAKKLFLPGLLHAKSIKQFLLDIKWKTHNSPQFNQHPANPEEITFAPPLRKQEPLLKNNS